MADDVVLIVGGKRLAGWTSTRVTRRLEGLPNSFAFSATEQSPIYVDAGTVQEGDPFTLQIGADKVITGYVDDVVPALREGSHEVQVSGRGKCQDLVDCAAIWKSCQVSGANALEIAQKLAKPYGITASCIGDPGPAVPQFNIEVTQSPAEVLELVTRHAALLYYEGTDGNLILSRVSTDRAGSGFVEGQNIQAAQYRRSMAQRFSRYECALLSVETTGLFQDHDGLFYATATDPNVKRLRRMVIVAEGVQGGLALAQKRANWEAARRAGRGRAITITTDSWRDGKDKLWAPNTLASVQSPKLGLPNASLCISEVSYLDNLDSGRTAEVTLMPPPSFLPEPIQLQPLVGGLNT